MINKERTPGLWVTGLISLIILLCFFILFDTSVYAVSAYRDARVEVTQPDGVTSLILRPIGDERNGRLVTEDGYTVVKASDGWYHYASLDVSGAMVPSGVRANAPSRR